MNPPNPDLKHLLDEGIQAFRQGDHQRARDLFLSVVEQDERVELAWMWLVEVVDDPVDKMTALENVLALNPGNTEARRLLDHIQLQRQAADARAPAVPPPPPAEPETDNWRKLLPETPLESDDGIDDPNQCVYCGRLTAVTDDRCRHCGGRLYRMVQQSGSSEFLQLTLLLLAISLALGLIESLGPLFALSTVNSLGPSGYEMVSQIFGVEWVLGQFLQLPPRVIPTLISIYAARAVLLSGLLLLLQQRLATAYRGGLVVLLGDLLLSAYLMITGYIGLLGGALNAVLSLVILMLLVASDREFAVNRERLFTRPDLTARSAGDFHLRGHEYRRRRMWALAVAQWRRAVGLAPREAQFYKDLGIGYAHLRRFERSLRALAEAQRLAPQDKSLAEIVKLVKAQAAEAARRSVKN